MTTRKILKKIGKGFLILISSLIGLIALLLLLIRLNSPGKEEPIRGIDGQVLPHSIAMHEDRMINGVPQRLTIRGKDIRNPVLLIVHGGPGQPWPPVLYRLTHTDLEDLFTVCYWEQRGAGSAYYAHPEEIPDSTVTLPQIVNDGITVAQYLKTKFHKDKIYIEGLSWGTTVSAFMVQKAPSLFKAYVGVGQMANQPLSEQMSYDFAMKAARQHEDTLSIHQLQAIGRPPYPHKTNVEMAEACDVERTVVDRYAPAKTPPAFQVMRGLLFDKGQTFREKFIPMTNPTLLNHAYYLLWPTCFRVNLMRDVPEWPIPVYIIEGDHDHFTETALAKAYFDSLKAPEKHWYLFKNATHIANAEYPEKFRSIWLHDVLKK